MKKRNETSIKLKKKKKEILTCLQESKTHGMGSIKKKKPEVLFIVQVEMLHIKQGIFKDNTYLISLSLSLWITCKISLWLIGVLGYFSKT